MLCSLPDAEWNSRLPNLQELWLSNNSFSGSLPFSLPSTLTLLDLHTNKLTGTIRPDWELPSGLRILTCSQNFINGTLSANWRLPDSLFFLEMFSLNLTGTIPQWQLPKEMQFLYLNDNDLTGDSLKQ
jgi:hypothetical protein